ncbi:MAG: hypothetical protein WBZ29_14420 [Methanocella sp.]
MITKGQRMVLIFGGWVFLVLQIMALFQSINLEYYFMLCLTGLFIIVELSGPYIAKPRWRARIDATLAIGALIFGALVINKVQIMLGM